MIASFLRGRVYRVKVGEEMSVQRHVSAGVPQGSLLGPVLYNIFVCDIPAPPERCLLLTYADDVLVVSSGPRASTVTGRLNAYLASLHGYFKDWGLRLNVGKCVAVVFSGKSKRIVYPNFRRYVPVLRIGGRIIRVQDSMRYLGVVFHGRFDFCRHVDFVLCKAKSVYFGYCRLLGMRGGLPPDVRVLIYRQVIRPILTYAFSAWCGISSHQMERLRVWERRIIRTCLGMRRRVVVDGSVRSTPCRQIYGAVDFPRIDVFMVRSALRYFENSRASSNLIVQASLDHPPDTSSEVTMRHLRPSALANLNDEGMLFSDDVLIFYHRRSDSFNVLNAVYDAAQ